MFRDILKTFVLLTALSLLLLLLGSIFGGKTGLTMALVMALVLNGFAYFFSDKIVLKMYRAQLMDRLKHPHIYEIVEDLAHTMNLPMPKLYIIPSSIANAFATGRNPQNSSVAITAGIVDILDDHELRGVLAHELSHIKNRDILFATIAATIATAIGYMAQYAHYAALFGSRDSRNRRNNPIGLLLAVILIPMAATLLRLGLSRSREYLADDSGARYSNDPLALASALQKLERHVSVAHLDNKNISRASTAQLFIVNPFKQQITGRSLINLFSTHPPTQARIARLQKIFEQNISS